MKQPWEWTEDDILALIHDGVKESIDLDYKGCGSLENSDNKKSEISKDVSAFANSAGGTILYGVIEDNHLPVRIDVGYDPMDISKEWLEQVINSRIKRKIDSVKIIQIEIPKTSPGKVIYVVYVPQSNRAPHMASDNKYYKRYNFHSVPMEDYEVRDVMHRQETPDLQLQLQLTGSQLVFNNDQLYSEPIEMNISITNQAAMPAEYYSARLFIDERLTIISRDRFGLAPNKIVFNYGNKTYTAQELQLSSAIPHSIPIWQGEIFKLINTPIKLSLPKGQGEYFLCWQLSSPRMAKKEQFYIMATDGNIAFLIG